MMMPMVGAFAEFERAMLREGTKAGLDSARREGRIGGRRPKLSPQQQAEIRRMVSRGDKTVADAARLFRIHRAIRLPSSREATSNTRQEDKTCQIMLPGVRRINFASDTSPAPFFLLIDDKVCYRPAT